MKPLIITQDHIGVYLSPRTSYLSIKELLQLFTFIVEKLCLRAVLKCFSLVHNFLSSCIRTTDDVMRISWLKRH